jgi:hypothetical protein
VERRQITGSGGWQCEDRHAIGVLAQHLLPKLSGAFVPPAASASIPFGRRLRRVGQRGGYMSDLASCLVRSAKSKERCVNAILSAESNIEDAVYIGGRNSGSINAARAKQHASPMKSLLREKMWSGTASSSFQESRAASDG